MSAPVLKVPLTARAPVQPFEAVQAVALVLDQVSVAVAPLATRGRRGAEVTVGTGMTGVTVTVALAGAEVPPAPVQVSV